MNREQIIRMAREAGFVPPDGIFATWDASDEDLERFATLVAQHTLMNIDPSKFMSWQESYEAGVTAEREACAKLCEDNWHECGGQCANVIRYGERGQA